MRRGARVGRSCPALESTDHRQARGSTDIHGDIQEEKTGARSVNRRFALGRLVLGEWPKARRHAGALAWTGLDQVFSTLSNAVVSLALARGAGASGLGVFTVAFGAYLLVVGFQRVLIAEPLMASSVKMADREPERAALGAAIIFSTSAALALLGLGAILSRSEFIVLALVLPFVCGQDLLRYVAFRRLDARTATMLDLAWTAVSVSAWWLIRAGSVDRAVLLWGAGAALGMVLGLFLLRLVPAGIQAAWHWWKCDARVFGLALAIEGVAYTVTAQAWVFIVAGALGNADLGALRAAQILLAPSAPLLAAFSTLALPRMARRATELTHRDSQLASIASLALAAPLVVVPVVAAHPLTRLLYGASFSVPYPLLIAVAFASLLGAAAAGPMLSLKAQRLGRRLVSARVTTGALGLVFVAAVLSAGVTAVAWAMAAQNLVYLAAVWTLEMRTRTTSVSSVGAVTSQVTGLSEDPT
jgi:O-antigen/teichoic acid export membrane protein